MYWGLSVYQSMDEMVHLHLAVDKVVKEVVSHTHPLDSNSLLVNLDLLKIKVVLNLHLV